MKIPIPKNTWISSVDLGFLREGFFSGVYALEIAFSGGACPGDEFLAEIAEQVTKLALPKRRIARLTGLFPRNDNEIELLVQLLKSWGFQVQAVITDGFQASWLKHLDWVIVILKKKMLLSPANEVWYFPTPEDTIPEPKLPPNKPYLLYITKGISLSATQEFVLKAEQAWSLL